MSCAKRFCLLSDAAESMTSVMERPQCNVSAPVQQFTERPQCNVRAVNVLSTERPQCHASAPVQQSVSAPNPPRVSTVRPQRGKRTLARSLQCSTSVLPTCTSPSSDTLPWWQCEERSGLNVDSITSVPGSRQSSAPVQQRITSVMEKTILSYGSLVPGSKPSRLQLLYSALTPVDFDRRYDLSQYRIDGATRDAVLRDFEYVRTAVPQPVLEDEGGEFFSDIQISSADVSTQSKKRLRDDSNSFDAAHVSKSTAVEISTVTATNVISSCNVLTSSSPPLLLGGEDSQDQFASIVASVSNTDINDIQPSLNLFDAESSTVAGYLVEPVSPADTVLFDEREAEQSANDSDNELPIRRV